MYETIEFSDSSNLYTEPVKPIYDKETITTKQNSSAQSSIIKNSNTAINGNVKNNSNLGNSSKKGYRTRRENLNTILSTDEEDEDSFLRSKPTKQFSAIRGSSKVMCSLVSVGLVKVELCIGNSLKCNLTFFYFRMSRWNIFQECPIHQATISSLFPKVDKLFQIFQWTVYKTKS